MQDVAKKLNKYLPIVNILAESLRAFKISMRRISHLQEIYQFFSTSIQNCVNCIEDCMKHKWSTESLRHIFKFKYESDELQNVFEVISAKHLEIQQKLGDIDDDK